LLIVLLRAMRPEKYRETREVPQGGGVAELYGRDPLELIQESRGQS
jgi:hypothetical protein